ncbi:MAG: hypothetical protein J7L63_00405 [Thermoplasmata archaeon]|nr:hypothetical protein [Thermoplasmata archaeon]
MKTTRIDFTSDNNRCIATIQRRGEYLLAELFSPEVPNGRKHWVQANDEDDIRSAADMIFYFLEGHEGTNSDIHDAYLRLLPLSDL